MSVILTVGYREDRDPTSERLRYVLAHPEEFAGEEGFGVSLTSAESEWSLSFDQTGQVIWMNLSHTFHGVGAPKHQRGVTPERAFALWTLLAEERIGEIEREPWLSPHLPHVVRPARRRLAIVQQPLRESL